MGNLIENICLVFVIICIIGLMVSLIINNITIFFFSVLFMIAFWAIAMIDIARK